MRLWVAVLLSTISIRAAERCDVPTTQAPEGFGRNRLLVDTAVFQPKTERDRYAALLARHPDNPDYQYLRARSLVGSNTLEALRIYGRILDKDPDYPWVHLSQLEIFKNERFRDRKKLQASFETFARVCPSSIAPYHYLDQIPDHGLATRAAAKLRVMLKDATNERDLTAYEALWSVELESRPIGENADELRQIAEDVKRLMPFKKLRSIPEVISNGAMLTGDHALKQEMDLLRPEWRVGSVATALQAWQKEHPNPKGGDPPEKWRAFAEARLAESAKLVDLAPDQLLGYSERFDALVALEAPPEQIRQAGDELRQVVFRHDELSNSTALVTNVPRAFVARDIYLDRVPAMLEDLVERLNSDMRPLHGDARERMARAVQNIDALELLVQVDEKRGQFEQAHDTLRRMEAVEAANRPPAGITDPEVLNNFSLARYDLWNCTGRLAELEGRKLDALSAYRETMAARPGWQWELGPQRKLWDELGGSEEGWRRWVAAIPKEPVRPSAASSADDWIPRLPAMSLKDFGGNLWTLDRLQGKTAVVAVWATWCGWCLQELPYIQKLAERMKGRDDVLVMSFNVDEDVGSAESYFKNQKYSFPAVLAKQYAEDLMGGIGVPRTWIIKNGSIAYEWFGFGAEPDKWMEEMLTRLK